MKPVLASGLGNVVLLTPDHLAAPDQIEGERHQPIDCLVSGIAAMCPIVHNIEPHKYESLGQSKGSHYSHNK